LKVTGTHPNRVVLDVAGSTADIENAFHVRINVYQHPRESRTFYAPDSKPSVDTNLSVPILGISGLDNFSLPHPTGLRSMPAKHSPGGTDVGSGSGPGGAYLGKDFSQAYVPGTQLDGTGQTVALFEFDGYYTNDITAYETLAGLPRAKLTNIPIDGGPRTPGNGDLEVSVDIESPNITVVGGTTLTMDRGARVSETVWNTGLSTNNDANKGEYIGTGGGISPTYPIPLWQQGINSFLFNGGSTTARNVPDVAMNAENVYVKYGNGAGGTFWGTSCAAPLWAGFMALVNQQAAAAGQPRVGFINPAIYEIANESIYGACFNDIVTGNNTWPASPHAFYAISNYDLCTGLGTLTGTNLINALVSPDPLVVIPNGGFHALGSPAGTFDIVSQTYFLTNGGTTSFDWTLVNTSAWLNVSSGGGTLAPGAGDSVTVSLNTVASNLAAGIYSASLWFSNVASGVGHSRLFTLAVNDPLVILPQKLVFQGPSGGPFSPPTQGCILTNASASTVSWGILNTSAWFNVSPASGTLSPGAQADVSLLTTPLATNLVDGFYTSVILVTNLTSQYVQPVTGILSVMIVQNGGFETGDFSDWTLVGNGGNPAWLYNGVVDANYFDLGSGYDGELVHSGAFGAFLGDTNIATLSQTLTTIPGQRYLLSFWLDNPTSGSGEQFMVYWNTNRSGTNRIYSLNNPPAFAWRKLAFVVTATDTNTTLQFDAQNDQLFFGLDDVNVVAVLPAFLDQPADQSHRGCGRNGHIQRCSQWDRAAGLSVDG
jgi:hypothetical protein